MAQSREMICESTSTKLAAAVHRVADIRTLVGLDGFVDEIIAVVDKRTDAHTYDAVRTIEQMGQKILRAAGESSNYELLVKQQKLGGNGPIMANALAAIGFKVTYVGNLGKPAVHPVFQALADRAEVFSIAEPGHTDALEFDDGKLMFGKHGTLKDVNWDNLIEGVGGTEKLREIVSRSGLIGMTNWTMLPYMSDIWSRLQTEIFPGLARGDRKIFIDLADPEKRTGHDILEALELTSRFQAHADVILGLNLKESSQVAEVLAIRVGDDAEAAVEATARSIRAKLGVSCVVIHPRRRAAAATADTSATFAGPFVQQPKISTGAGDHFNAGFCLGEVLGLSLAESLCTGVGTSGYYVRNAQSPSATELAGFIAKLPAPQA